MSARRLLHLFGRVLIAAGLLLLLFSAFQLWGTGLLEARSQSALRAHLEHELPPGALGHTPSAKDVVVGDEPAPAGPAPADGQPVGVIDIPAIGLDQVVVEGVRTADLRMGPGHYPGTPLPGQPGNAAIAGHRTTYGHPFYSVDALVPGDRIIITTPQGFFLYRVTNVVTVLPWNTTVLAPTNRALLTLTTCQPRYSASHRLVVRAALARSLLFADQPRPGHPAAHPPTRAAPGTDDLAGEVSGGSWPAVLGWGVLTVAVAVGTWLLARRTRRRWLVYSGGTVAVLVVLFFFFSSVSPLLPASF